MKTSIFLFIILFLVFNFSVRAQHVVVDYRTISNGDFLDGKDKSNNSSNTDIINEAFKFVNLMTMRLKASPLESYFWVTTEMNSDVDELNFKLAKVFVQSNSEYRCDLKNDVISRWSIMFGRNFIINKNISNLNWKLTNEKKEIGEYMCYKAYSTYEVVNTSGTFIKTVTAWYTAEIPYRFGPKGYCGLPGLILELTDDKITYIVKNIYFHKNDGNIGSLPKGEIITQKALDDLAINAMKDRRKNVNHKR